MSIWTGRKHKRTGKALTNHIHGLCQAYMDEIRSRPATPADLSSAPQSGHSTPVNVIADIYRRAGQYEIAAELVATAKRLGRQLTDKEIMEISRR